MVRCRAINGIGWINYLFSKIFLEMSKIIKFLQVWNEEDSVLIVINKFNYFILQHMSLRKYLRLWVFYFSLLCFNLVYFIHKNQRTLTKNIETYKRRT